MNVVYLLHFEKPMKDKLHYVGICQTGRLARRMWEHRTGRGASITRRAVEAGSHLYLGNLWRDQSYADERKIKTRGHFINYCRVCNSKQPPAISALAIYEPAPKATAPKQSSSARAPLSFD